MNPLGNGGFMTILLIVLFVLQIFTLAGFMFVHYFSEKCPNWVKNDVTIPKTTDVILGFDFVVLIIGACFGSGWSYVYIALSSGNRMLQFLVGAFNINEHRDRTPKETKDWEQFNVLAGNAVIIGVAQFVVTALSGILAICSDLS